MLVVSVFLILLATVLEKFNSLAAIKLLCARGFGANTVLLSEHSNAEPLINGGEVIFGEGGKGETDSGRGVVGKGDIMGVSIDLLGEGGIGDSGGEGGLNILGLSDLLRSIRCAGTEEVLLLLNNECLRKTDLVVLVTLAGFVFAQVKVTFGQL